MKTQTEYAIYKRIVKEEPEYWDGPYKSLRAATEQFDKHYAVEGKRQDFIIAKVTYEFLPRKR